jgi:quinol monooxygenase YgiN
MSKVSMMGTFSCQDGKANEMEAVLRKMVEAARAEPGIEIYSYHRGEGNNFSFFALMASSEAMQAHGQTDAMRGHGGVRAPDGGASSDVVRESDSRDWLRRLTRNHVAA